MRIELFDGSTTVGLEVDAGDPDVTVSVLVDDAEVAGIDPAAGTVGTWPDGQTWNVVFRIDPVPASGAGG